MKTGSTSLKALMQASAGEVATSAPPPKAPIQLAKPAGTRNGTSQISGHYPSEVAQTVRVIAAEQGMDVQEVIAIALNMVFERYGKPTRAPITSGRRIRGKN